MAEPPSDDASRDAFLKAMNGRKPRPRRSWNNDRATRGLGFGILLYGALMSWTEVWIPLQSAAAHAYRIEVSDRGVMMAPLLVGVGLLYTIMGSSAWRVMGDAGKPSKTGMVLTGGVVACMFLLGFWFKAHFEGMGYVFVTRSWFDQ